MFKIFNIILPNKIQIMTALFCNFKPDYLYYRCA